MVWSYSGDPSASDLDEVRYLSGDIDTNEQLVSDAEVAYSITKEYNNAGAAACVCEALAALYSREVTSRVGAGGEFTLDLQQKAEAFRLRAKELRQASFSYATPICGGISIDDKNDQLDDTDRVRPFFKRDMFSDGGVEERTETWQETNL